MPRRTPTRRSRRVSRTVRVASYKRIALRNRQPRGGRKTEFVISQIPHSRQRYPTIGDWIPGSPVRVNVSRMKDERYVFLVALHEMIEYELCKMKGVKDGEVVAFDVNFERERARGMHAAEAEPGDDPRAPYREEHSFATMVEMMVAQKLGVKWSAYEQAVVSLGPKQRILMKPLIRDSLR